jgi:GTPase SAR1 family protein
VVTLFFLGPAGSGKTTLVWAFGRYLEREGYAVSYVNLDCAAETVPYSVSFDVRRWFTLSDIMKRYGLGPNGAMVKSLELILERLGAVREIFGKLERSSEYVLVDTPGQLEPLVFHNAGPLILRGASSSGVGVFLVPVDVLKTPRDAVFLTLMALSIKYRLDIPLVTVFSKRDLATEPPDIDSVFKFDVSSFSRLGVEGELAYRLMQVIREYGALRQRPVFVSSLTEEGLDDLLSVIHEVACTCGDMR